MSGSSKAVRLPPCIELSFDTSRSAREQVTEVLEQYRESYAWFAALDAEPFERLVDALVVHCAEALEDAKENPVPITIEMEELQKICESLLPLSELNSALLEALDLPHVFGTHDETARQNTYSQLVAAKYERTGALSAAARTWTFMTT